MRTLIATALSLILTTAAMAAQMTPDAPRELKFTLASAKVTKFERPIPSRSGKYDVALVISVRASRTEWEVLPPATEPFLYIGTHELHPYDTQLDGDRVTIIYHDPKWQELQGGELMVVTTDHGEPINNPEKYAGSPRFDPRVIDQK